MKRYMVFVYDRYYPSGGINDFEQDFDRIEDAKDFVQNKCPYSWNKSDIYDDLWHIYDLDLKKIVANHEYSDNYEKQYEENEAEFRKIMENDK